MNQCSLYMVLYIIIIIKNLHELTKEAIPVLWYSPACWLLDHNMWPARGTWNQKGVPDTPCSAGLIIALVISSCTNPDSICSLIWNPIGSLLS